MSSCWRGGGQGLRVYTRGLVPPLIDAFSSSQRGMKPLVVLENGIPGQTGCLYGDGLGRGGGRGKEFCHSWMQTRCGKWIWSDRSTPQAT